MIALRKKKRTGKTWCSMPSARALVKSKRRGAVESFRFEVHVLVPRGKKYTGAQLHRFAADWANGYKLPSCISIKLLRWEKNGHLREELTTPVKIEQCRARFAGMLRSTEIAVEKQGRKD